MRMLQALGIAWRRIRRRPVRSFLLLQGTVWGVAVAVFPSAVLQGTREAMVMQGEQLGADRFTMVADTTASSATPLRVSDVARIRAWSEGGSHGAKAGTSEHAMAKASIRGVAGLSVLGPIKGESKEDTSDEPMTALAATHGVFQARGLDLAAGRDLQPGDGRDVCVVEALVVPRLFGEAVTPDQALQRHALMPDGNRSRIVGVARARPPDVRRSNDLGFDVEHKVYKGMLRNFLIAMGMPALDDGWKRSDLCVYRSIQPVDAKEDPDIEWIMGRGTYEGGDIASMMRDAMREEGRDTLVMKPLVLSGLMSKRIDRFAAVPYAMFLACLVMGAVVMANLGLLNTLSRREEIAVQRVEGATRADIAWQFLFEGLLLSGLGCLLGCLLGVALATLRVSLEPVTGFTWKFPWMEAGIAVAVAMLVGLLAAWIPAWRASRQEPVVGLHDA